MERRTNEQLEQTPQGRGKTVQWNKDGLWSRPDRIEVLAVPLTGSIRFSACSLISEMVLDRLLEEFIKIMPVKHLTRSWRHRA